MAVGGADKKIRAWQIRNSVFKELVHKE